MLIDRFSKYPEGVLLPFEIRQDIDFLLRELMVGRPEDTLRLMDDCIIPAVLRGNLSATAIAPSIHAGPVAFRVRMQQTIHVETRFEKGGKVTKLTHADFVDAAAKVAPKTVLDLIESTKNEAAFERYVTTGFGLERPTSVELVEKWIKLVDRLSDSDSIALAKHTIRGYVERAPLEAEEKNRLLSMVRATPYTSVEEYVVDFDEELQGTKKYLPYSRQLPTVLERFSDSDAGVQLKILEWWLSEKVNENQDPVARDWLVAMVDASTIDWTEHASFLDNSIAKAPTITVPLARVVSKQSLDWAFPKIWRLLPKVRQKRTDYCVVDLNSILYVSDAMSTLDLKGYRFREDDHFPQQMKKFMADVPVQDQAELRKVLFEYHLCRYDYENAYEQVKLIDSPRARANDLFEILSFSLAFYRFR